MTNKELKELTEAFKKMKDSIERSLDEYTKAIKETYSTNTK